MQNVSTRLNQAASEAVLDVLKQSKDHAVIMVSLTGQIDSWNIGASRLFGYPTETVVGRHSISFLHPTGESPFPASFKLAHARGSWEGPVHCRGMQGELLSFLLRIILLFEENGGIARYLLVYRDADQPAEDDPTSAHRALLAAAAQREESDNRFHRLIELVEDHAIVSLDADGCVTSWNRAAARIAGYRPEQIVGQHLRLLFPRTDAAGEKADTLLATARTRGASSEEGWHRRQDGSRFWASTIVTALRNDANNLVGFGLVIHDLSELRQAEKALRETNALLHAFLNHSPSVMFFKDPAGRYLEVNDQFLSRFGVEREQVIGKTDAQIFAPEQAAEYAANDLLAMKMDGPYVCEEHAHYLDGDHTSIVYKFRVPYGPRNKTALGGIVVDITERKKTERENERLNAELTERNRMLEAFGYSVSHDLAAPLRAISGFADILNERYAASLDERGRHFLANIIDASDQMSRMIDDLLAYSRLGRSAVVLEEASLHDIVCSVLKPYRRKIEQAGAIVKIDESRQRGMMDRRMLAQALGRVFDNALMYHQPGAPASIHVQFEGDDTKGCLVVSDAGIGIEPAYLDKIFGIFQRLHSHDAYPGTGMGLALAQRAVALMGGRMWAESEPGKGSRFIVELPLRN